MTSRTTRNVSLDILTRSVWLLPGSIAVALGIGVELMFWGTDVLDNVYFLIVHGSFYVGAVVFMYLAATIRPSARWILLFGSYVLFAWAFLVGMATGLDGNLIPPALMFLIVPAVAFRDKQPRRTGRTV